MNKSEILKPVDNASLETPEPTALSASVGGQSDEERLAYLLSLLARVDDDPIEGLAGYLVTEDPTYLPEDAEIKVLARLMGRDKLLRLILSHVLEQHAASEGV